MQIDEMRHIVTAGTPCGSSGFNIEDLSVEQFVEITTVRAITKEVDGEGMKRLSGDENPIHFDEAFARTTIFRTPLVHGMLGMNYVSALMGVYFPGPGCGLRRIDNVEFPKAVRYGSYMKTRAEVGKIDLELQSVVFWTTNWVNEQIVISGDITLYVPKRRQKRDRAQTDRVASPVCVSDGQVMIVQGVRGVDEKIVCPQCGGTEYTTKGN